MRGLLSNDLDYIGQDVTFAVEILAGVVFFELASITPVPEWLKVLGGALGGILAGWGAGQVFGPEVADQVKDLFVNYVTGIIVQTEGDLEGIAKREGLGNDYAVTLQENDQSWWDVGHPLSNTGITVPSFVISLTFLPQVPDSGGEFQESSGGITS